MTPALIGIRHVALYSRALEDSERFFVDVLGYRVEWRPDADNVYLTRGTDNLALHRAPAGALAAPADARQGALDHVGLAAPAPGDVDAWAARLAAAGIALERDPKTHRDGSRSLYVREPGGVLLQIIHHGPISGSG